MNQRAGSPSPTRMPLAFLLSVTLALFSCAPLPPPQAPLPTGPPPGFPEGFYRDAQQRGLPVYRIEPARSPVVVRVYRAGPLAGFGHEHVVSSHRIEGYALWPRGGQARADLYLPLATLEVDDPQLRRQAGLSGTLRPEDTAATRRNMLGPVLEADRFPYLRLHVRPTWQDGSLHLSIDLNLHGTQRHLVVPAVLQRAQGAFTIRGAMRIRQTDFSIVPYSALGGALRVADALDIDFRIQALRWSGVSVRHVAADAEGMSPASAAVP